MNDTIDGLKQRLVGAFVILSLAIIFLPMIFDKPHTSGKSTIVPVPPKPKYETVVVTKPKKPSFERVELDPADNRVKESKSIVEVKKIEAAKPVAAAKQLSVPSGVESLESSKKEATVNSSNALSKPTVSQLPIFKNVWMVQLGTFSLAENAYRLRDQLRSDGFDGHIKQINVKGKDAVRVFTGPFVNKREAEKTKKKLDGKYRLDSLVVYFDA